MMEKSRIVEVLGEEGLRLPALLNEALAANDRAKYLFTVLQVAQGHADRPGSAAPDHRARIAWIRSRYMDTKFLRAAFEVVVGGLIVFAAGILIGSA